MTMKFIAKLVSNVLAIYICTVLFDTIEVSTTAAIIQLGVILFFANLIIKPILSLVMLPLTIMTFGIFSLVISTLMVIISDLFISGINIQGFTTAFFVAIFVSLINSIVNLIYKK